MKTSNPNINLESKVIKRFVLKRKHDRYLPMIKNLESRGSFTGQLAHFNDFKYELFEEVKGNERSSIKNKISSFLNIKDCYIISENPEIDQKTMSIDLALNEVIGVCLGSVLVFGDAELIYYEAEGPNDRWITKTIYREY